MDAITIPKKLARNGDLIVVPRKEYEELLRIHKKHKQFYDDLDKDLGKTIKSYKNGKAIGPFHSIASLKKSLKK